MEYNKGDRVRVRMTESQAVALNIYPGEYGREFIQLFERGEIIGVIRCERHHHQTWDCCYSVRVHDPYRNERYNFAIKEEYVFPFDENKMIDVGGF